MDSALEALSPLALSVIAYADDLVIMWGANARTGLEAVGASVARTLAAWCDSQKLTVSPTKSALVVFGSKLSRAPIVRIQDGLVPVVLSHTYLGVTLDRLLLFRELASQIAVKASVSIMRLRAVAGRQYGNRLPDTALPLYRGVFEGILLYAAAVWAHRLCYKTYVTTILRAQRRALVLFTGAYRSTPP